MQARSPPDLVVGFVEIWARPLRTVSFDLGTEHHVEVKEEQMGKHWVDVKQSTARLSGVAESWYCRMSVSSAWPREQVPSPFETPSR